jgi:glycerol-3-phosphate acyltransferase PlsY
MSPLDPGVVPDPLRSPGFVAELRRKTVHLSFILLPLVLLHEWLPWPRGRSEWRLLLLALVVGAIAVDIMRIHERRVGRFFREFFGEMIRAHEHRALLGSTYLLLAALLAVEIFPQTVAAAAIGFTVLGDGFAAIVGRAFGRHRVFGKTWEGSLGCLVASLAWAALLASGGQLPWGVALAGAVVASLVEFLPIPLDDNLGITLFAGYAMKLLWSPA